MNPLLIQAGATLGAAAINRIFNRRPEVPDLVESVNDQYTHEARELEAYGDRQSDRIESDLTAQGVTGSGSVAARRDLMDRILRERAGLLARRSGAIADARNQMKQMEFQQRSQSHAARAQALGSLAGSVGQYFTNREMLGQLSDAMTQASIDPNDLPNPGYQTNPLQSYLSSSAAYNAINPSQAIPRTALDWQLLRMGLPVMGNPLLNQPN